MTLVKKKFDELDYVFIKPPPLYSLIKMREFNIKNVAFFWCDYTQKLQKIKMLMENTFLNNKSKDEFLVNFARFQRTVNAFKKLVRMWRIKKKFLFYPNTTDLKGNELSEYKHHLVIDLIENKTIYSFYILDLLKMWNMALRQRMYVIETPTKLKNPYTNLEFSASNLYNIYYKARFNGIRIPLPVEMHFNCSFSMTLLLHNYGSQLREFAISDYTESDDVSLYNELIAIQNDYGYLLPKLRVRESFSEIIKMKQIKIYNPIIQAYCFMSYSNNSHLISRYNSLFFKLVDAYAKEASTIFF